VTRDTGTTGNRCTSKTATTGITVANDNYGAGSSQNVQPTAVVLKIIKT
jgi:hypothetical protein